MIRIQVEKVGDRWLAAIGSDVQTDHMVSAGSAMAAVILAMNTHAKKEERPA